MPRRPSSLIDFLQSGWRILSIGESKGEEDREQKQETDRARR
jgi:hypothetical protein